MRLSPRSAAAVALLLPLAAASCSSSKSQSWPAQPVPAMLTDYQANTLAQQYLDQHAVAAPRVVTAEERQPDGWWLYYQTPFNASARPPSLVYLMQVNNDGTVNELFR
jgi:hypothetical protein